jgi:predicted TIM-barrel fold metal-dependent hydrolase
LTVSETVKQRPFPKYRRIPGGLDHAVKYAESNDLYEKYSIIDLDVHEGQPFSCFAEYLPEKWKGKVNNQDLLKRENEYIRNLDSRGTIAKSYAELNFPQTLKEGKFTNAKMWAYRQQSGHQRPEAWLVSVDEMINIYVQRMKDMGIKKTFVLPGSIVFSISQDSRVDLEVDSCNAFTNFYLDKVAGKYEDIYTVLPVPVRSPDEAIRLVDRAWSEKSIGALYLLGSYDVQAGDQSYYPIYEACEEKRIPIIFHADFDISGYFESFDNYAAISSLCFPMQLAKHLTGLITEGIFERFPHLTFAFIEAGLSWVPWLISRLDFSLLERRRDSPWATKLPSEYMAEKCYFGTQPLENAPSVRGVKWMFDFFRERGMMNKIVYSSDYPHPDWDPPQAIHGLSFLSDQEKRMILGENARNFMPKIR